MVTINLGLAMYLIDLDPEVNPKDHSKFHFIHRSIKEDAICLVTINLKLAMYFMDLDPKVNPKVNSKFHFIHRSIK